LVGGLAIGQATGAVGGSSSSASLTGGPTAARAETAPSVTAPAGSQDSRSILIVQLNGGIVDIDTLAERVIEPFKDLINNGDETIMDIDSRQVQDIIDAARE